MLEETAAAPVIEAAFAGDGVDFAVCGDWEDVQVALGLLPERVTPPAYLDGMQPRGPVRETRAEAKAKARRKAEKEARKRNRKKR